jgi:hypothetical protein
MTPRDIALLRRSLVAVWCVTALVSALGAHDRSAALLAAAGVAAPLPAALALWGGIALDATIGLALAFAPLRLAATLALAATLLMTVVTTALLPATWLDPLGSLLKNLPILALLVVLRRNSP